MEGTTFGEVPINCEMRLEVWDSPNSAGVVIDAIRCAKLALDRGLSGALVAPSSYFMKTPPRQFTDEEARALTEAFIRGDKVVAVGADRDRSRANLRPRSAPYVAANGSAMSRNGKRNKQTRAK
jgi:myo-inositol-1-phosphate synthase